MREKGSLCARDVYPTQLRGFYMTPAAAFRSASLRSSRPSTLDFLNIQTSFVITMAKYDDDDLGLRAHRLHHGEVANAVLAGKVHQASCELERQVTQALW